MRRYTRRVRRAILFAVSVAIALSLPLVSGASLPAGTGKAAAQHAVSGHFTVRLRYKTGPWVTKLSIQLKKTKLIEFKVCGVWNWPAERRFSCLAAGSRLPERTTARMEQNPVANAMKRDDSPGWGMVGLSDHPVINVPLSNTETGDRYGTFYYRVTLRDLSGAVLLTSNKVAIVWHR